uniref:Uncharacterized protein n=1 Tax=Parascaris equorum TaxID=6256 RepID=A0A914RGS0_PAREQ
MAKPISYIAHQISIILVSVDLMFTENLILVEISDELKEVVLNIQMPAIAKPLDITDILRENPDVLNMIASFPFMGVRKEEVSDELHIASNSRNSPERTASGSGKANEDWFVCFEGPCILATALTASLNVISKGTSDGYECLNRLRFKCSYRIRLLRFGENFICEESGVHRHKADTQLPLSSTGLPRSMREIVDESFRDNWTYMERQHNRLSYLRRTRNIRQMQQIEQKLSTTTNEEKQPSPQSPSSALNENDKKR